MVSLKDGIKSNEFFNLTSIPTEQYIVTIIMISPSNGRRRIISGRRTFPARVILHPSSGATSCLSLAVTKSRPGRPFSR